MPEMEKTWADVDAYAAGLLLPPDPVLDEVLKRNREAGLPEIDVSPLQGSLLALLVRLGGARRVLEIGTLGGYSSIWMARALPAEGRLTTLEMEARHAAVARENFAAAGLADRIELRVGPALASLEALGREQAEPFDLVFIDADKSNNANYLAWAMRLSRPGTVIVVDNVVREGRVVDAASRNPTVRGSRDVFDFIAGDARLEGTLVQTVGAKGYDGFAIAMVGAAGD